MVRLHFEHAQAMSSRMTIPLCSLGKRLLKVVFYYCWGGNISKLDRRLEKIVKRAGHVVGKPLDSFKTLHEKRLYRKLMQMLNDPYTHPVRHYFDSRRSNRSGRFFLPRTNTNRY